MTRSLVPYRPPWWLRGGNAQTIYAALVLRGARIRYRRERWDTPDGDFILADWLDGPADAPLVALFHGLEGGSGSHYARALMAAIRRRGWRGVVPHFRGCGGEPNNLPRAYHSGDSREIDWMVRRLRAAAGTAPLFAVGVSLGGNVLLKWLGEEGDAARGTVRAAAAVSAPVDLTAAGNALGRGFNLVYAWHFLGTLKRKTTAKLARFPGCVDGAALARARTLRQFDDAVTAPLHGFRDASDYWARSSAKPLMAGISVPTLVINARDDPFMPGAHLPASEHVSPEIVLDFPATGGHVGFVSGPFPGSIGWLPERVLGFFEARLAAAVAWRRAGDAIIEAPLRASVAMQVCPPEIFKAYDIRGIVGRTLTVAGVERIGQALGSECLARGGRAIAIGRDGRLSGPELAQALARGIQASGVDVVDVGMVTTPMGYFAAHELGTRSAVLVTGSHNPPEYNGLKMVLNGVTLSGETIQQLRRRVESGDLASGTGEYRQADVREAYLARIAADVKLARPMRVAVDCGNGVAGAVAPELYRRLGCVVSELYCQVDGSFPNHHPDPTQPKNLADLIAELGSGTAELGLAFDGDGDRLGVVTRNGRIIYADRLLMLLAADVLARRPGAEIVFDVKCTRNLPVWIRRHGGRPVLWKTGHSLIKARMQETGAALAGEMSGHIFFAERWYGFDEGVYAGARLLEVLSQSADPSAVLEALPDSVATPELHLPLAEGEPHRLIAQLQREARFPGATEVVTLDGLRVEYPDGFGLARASNTTPVIVLRFEAQDEAGLRRIQEAFRAPLLAAKPDAKLPF